MKKIIILLLSFVCLFVIYKCFDNNKINYVSISDYSIYHDSLNYNDYIYKYLTDSNKLSAFNTEFINNNAFLIYKDLLNNRTIRINNNDYFFKKVLRESDLVVINIGMEELYNKYDKYNINTNYENFNKIYSDLKILLKEIRKYAKGRILFIGFYNPYDYYDAKIDEFFYKVNIELNNIMIDNNIIYINLYEIIKGNNYIKNKLFLNQDGYKQIANIIKFYIENT